MTDTLDLMALTLQSAPLGLLVELSVQERLEAEERAQEIAEAGGSPEDVAAAATIAEPSWGTVAKRRARQMPRADLDRLLDEKLVTAKRAIDFARHF